MAKSGSQSIYRQIFDKIFSNKLYTNEIISGISENKILSKQFDDLKFESQVNNDYINKIYEEFAKKDEYLEYLKNEFTQGAIDRAFTRALPFLPSG